MNKVMIMGRLTRDVDFRDGNTAIARYTVAVNRRFKREGQPDADFIPCIAFGKSAEFAQKYFQKGTKVVVTGRIQTGSYTNREGIKVYTTDVIVEEQEFAESKNAGGGATTATAAPSIETTPVDDGPITESQDEFMDVPDDDDDLPFM